MNDLEIKKAFEKYSGMGEATRRLATEVMELRQRLYQIQEAYQEWSEILNSEEHVEQLAEQMFNAYNEQGPNPWKTHDGRDVPKWHELGDQVQSKWKAAAQEAINQIQTARSGE